MIAGCYTLDLYCDNEGDQAEAVHGYGTFPHQFTAETGGNCRKQARHRGWRFTRDGRVICPKCSAKKRVA